MKLRVSFGAPANAEMQSNDMIPNKLQWNVTYNDIFTCLLHCAFCFFSVELHGCACFSFLFLPPAHTCRQSLADAHHRLSPSLSSRRLLSDSSSSSSFFFLCRLHRPSPSIKSSPRSDDADLMMATEVKSDGEEAR
ncbi:uncharacterized protein G2W53_002330 [Senna tora]|uniref:Uncharacterized protein n=1 Tax=Senna tora TaxID=362788 RepID=A0A834XH67_9FABA|nr:uncharacterized protein G2W53_002330 [Senna tora]